jgi:hypothetical protein
VTLHFTPEEAIFQIRDEGQGFSVQGASAGGLENLLRGGQGQGLLLMWAFMDKVAFNQSGNTVSLRKLKETPQKVERLAKNRGVQSPPRQAEVDASKANLGRLVQTNDPSKSIVLSRRRITIGRAESCDLVIQSSSISHHHCQLYLHQGWWFVKDLQSTNRTKVNRIQVSQNLLRPGDTLTIGKLEFQIEYHPHELGAEGITPPVNPF